MVLAMTSQAVHNIRNRASKMLKDKKMKVTIGSAEALQMQQLTNVNNLHIDEATMFDYMQLIPLLGMKWKRIYLYGDNNQIGFIDMF